MRTANSPLRAIGLALSIALTACGSGEVSGVDAATPTDVPSADVTRDDAPATDVTSSDVMRVDVATTDAVTPSDAGPEQCSAVFRFLQKDAYRDGPGRTTSLWPPHTTTVLDVSCARGGAAPAVVASAYMENHGTLPSAVDMASGRPILQETRVVGPVYGTRAELLSLLDAYRACECAPGTRFLSLEALQDTAVQSLVGALIGYVQLHLACSGGVTVSGLVDALRAGRITDVIAALPSCQWNAGSGLAAGFDSAIQSALSATLAQYHVCNNDAYLQAQLFGTFQASHFVRACDNTSAACRSPRWFYEP